MAIHSTIDHFEFDQSIVADKVSHSEEPAGVHFEEVAVQQEHNASTVHIGKEELGDKIAKLFNFNIKKIITVSENHSSAVNFCDSSTTTAKTMMNSA